jgi:hypothetical protein
LLAVNDLIEEFERASRLPGRVIDQLKRYTREAGMLPASGRARTAPQNAPVHAAVLIAAALIEGPVLRVAEVLPRLWHASTLGPVERYWQFTPSPPDLPTDGIPATFGEALQLMIRASHHPIAAERKAFVGKFLGVDVKTDHSLAVLKFTDRTEAFHFDRPRPEGGITVTRSAAAAVFFALGEIVETSRIAAIEQGVTIPTTEAYAALKASPPNVNGFM